MGVNLNIDSSHDTGTRGHCWMPCHVYSGLELSREVPEKCKDDLEKMGLNERQIRAMNYIVKKGSISNKEYISLNNVSRKTATTDLKQLVSDGLLIRIGEGKRKIQYILPDYAKITQKGMDTF